MYWVNVAHYEAVAVGIDDTGSVEGIYAFMYWTKWESGQVLPMPDSLTDWLTVWQTLKDRVTQLLIKYKSGALVMQWCCFLSYAMDQMAGDDKIANADYQSGYPKHHARWLIFLRIQSELGR